MTFNNGIGAKSGPFSIIRTFEKSEPFHFEYSSTIYPVRKGSDNINNAKPIRTLEHIVFICLQGGTTCIKRNRADDDDELSAKEIKHDVMNAINKVARPREYEFCENSTRVITLKRLSSYRNRIEYSCDFICFFATKI